VSEKCLKYEKFHVLTATSTKMTTFSKMAPRSLAKVNCLLQRDYAALYPRKLSSGFKYAVSVMFLSKNKIKNK
jgi:hypothetical protein